MDRGDVGMGESSERARLAAEALARIRIGGGLPRQELECDAAAQALVLRQEDLAHAPLAERSKNAVVEEAFLRHGSNLALYRVVVEDGRAVAEAGQNSADRVDRGRGA